MRLAIDMLGMTVTEAAEMLEIEPRQMHRLIAGTTPVSREHAVRWLQRVGDIGHAAREANRVEKK
jgi:plasmid maintenance system antidote protein VapI